jgi:hypothetical protein
MNDEAGSSSAAPLTPPPQSPTEATTAPAAANNGTNEAPSFYFSRKPRLLDLIAVLDRVIWLEITVLYLLEYGRSTSRSSRDLLLTFVFVVIHLYVLH